MGSRIRLKLNKRRLFVAILVAIIVIVLIVFGILKLIKVTNLFDDKGPKTETKKPVVVEKKVQIIDMDSDTRPYAVMINCKSEALPQSGLQEAYMVYEETVEGGITRMVAFFKDKEMSYVGSVRSARVQYLPFVFEHDAIYVHAGGSLEATNRIANEGINHIDVDGTYGIRDAELRKTRAWEHTLFTKGSLLLKATNDYGYRKTTTQKSVLNYSADEVDLSKYETKIANKVSINYSYYRTSNYEYDNESKTYLRSMNDTKNVDLISGEQYKVKNIIIYGVQYNTIYLRGVGYSDPQIYGNGEGYYVTDGVALPITWEKKDEKSQTVYKIKEDGKELVVNDGNTYVQIYPSNGGNLSIS